MNKNRLLVFSPTVPKLIRVAVVCVPLLLDWPMAVLGQFSFVTNNGTITITGYSATNGNGNVIIPTSTNGYLVTDIGDSAFAYLFGVKNVTIPESIATIGNWAFESCYNLTNVTIGNGVISIGNLAFDNCQLLRSLTIPDSVTSIGNLAFAFSGFTSVTLGGGVATIGDSAFEFSTGLTNIAVSAANQNFTSVGGVLFNKTLTALVAYPPGLTGSFAIPSGVASIDGAAFASSTLTNITIPTSVTSIGHFAFRDCSGLTSMTIPDGVTNASMGDQVFFDCRNLTNVIFGNGLTNIGNFEFTYCSRVTSVTIGDSVISIGEGAFDGTGLPSVMIPGSVTSIGDGAFSLISTLTNITVDAGNPDYASAGGVLFDKTFSTLIQYPIGLAGGYAIPNSVTSIGDNAFSYSTVLASVTIPDSVTNMGDITFGHCSGLTNVTIPGSVTSIGSQDFTYCSSLGSVTIPNGVANIGSNAFYYCTGLASVLIGNSVTSIGDDAFAYCSNLANVVIPDSVASVGDDAFSNCSGLTSVTIGNGVIDLGSGAFYECSSLASITIPNSVTSIGDSAFAGCYSLPSVTIPGSVTNIGVSAFEFCGSLHQAYFQGNAPGVDGAAGSADSSVFAYDSGTAFVVPGTLGWGSTFGGWPVAAWYQSQPLVSAFSPGSSAQSNRPQFKICWATNTDVVVEASTNLQQWTPVATNTMVNGISCFADPQWTNFPSRFYRVRTPW